MIYLPRSLDDFINPKTILLGQLKTGQCKHLKDSNLDIQLQIRSD